LGEPVGLIAGHGRLPIELAASARRSGRRVVAIAFEGLADPALDEVVVTDSIPPFRLTEPAARAKVTVLPVGPLFAAAARRIHEGGSIVELVG
jgi:hypothetical protein